MAQIDIRNLTFAYPGNPENVFENFCLHFDTSWRLGLIGRNGRGKTTLLRLLGGTLKGSGSISAPAGIASFPPVIADEGRSVHCVMESLCPGLELWQAECELDRIGVSVEPSKAAFASLSPGEKTKVLLAAQFMAQPDYMLIDEPTNHLDRSGRQSLAAYLATRKGFLVVSHDREFLDGCTDHTVALNRSGMDVRRGSFSSWQADFETRQASELERNNSLKREIVRLGQSASRSEQWARQRECTKSAGLDSGYAGHKAAKLMKRAKAAEKRREQAVEEKRSLLHDMERADLLRMFPLAPPQELVLSCSHVRPAYPGLPFAAATFDLRRGDRVVLEGGNGTGKTSLLRLIAGEDVPCEGSVRKNGGLRISWLGQDTASGRGTLDDIAGARGLDRTQLLTMLHQLGFPRSHFGRRLETLSEGQRKKVLLAASLCERAHLYIWDEPLNYLDLYVRLQLEELIVRVQPTLLMVEHDAAFVRAVATKRVQLVREDREAQIETT